MPIVVSLATFLGQGLIERRKSSLLPRVPRRVVQKHEKRLLILQKDARKSVPVADGDTLNIVFDV